MSTTLVADASISITQDTDCLPVVELFGVPIHAITQAQCLRVVMDALRRGQGGWIITPNLDHLRRCRSDLRFAATTRMADMRVADGMPLIWASRLRGAPLRERVAGSDLIFSLSRELGCEGRSAFLLGGAPCTADRAAERLSKLYPGLQIAGTFCPHFGFERNPCEIRRIGEMLEAAQPDVVFVALGSPKQEYLIRMLRRRLPRTWWIGVGISFSFVCGHVRRAPDWMQRWGVEWIHRLVQEPGRLWKRYLLQGVPFCLLLLLDSVLARRGPSRLLRLILPSRAEENTRVRSRPAPAIHGSAVPALAGAAAQGCRPAGSDAAVSSLPIIEIVPDQDDKPLQGAVQS